MYLFSCYHKGTFIDFLNLIWNIIILFFNSIPSSLINISSISFYIGAYRATSLFSKWLYTVL